jgi:hypothetical protein
VGCACREHADRSGRRALPAAGATRRLTTVTPSVVEGCTAISAIE